MEKKNQNIINNLSSAEFAHGLVTVKPNNNLRK